MIHIIISVRDIKKSTNTRQYSRAKSMEIKYRNYNRLNSDREYSIDQAVDDEENSEENKDSSCIDKYEKKIATNNTSFLVENSDALMMCSSSMQSKIASDERYKLNSKSMNNKFAFIDANRKSLLFTIKDKDEMPEKVFWMNNIVILDQEINQAKKLTVEDEEGELLFKESLMIDASGLMTSLRKMRDGYSFFGTVDIYNNCLINDYVMNYPQEKCKTRMFVIFYDRTSQKYFFRPLCDLVTQKKALIYVKLTKPMKITSKTYFQIGQNVFSVETLSENLFIKVALHKFTGENNKIEYLFQKTICHILIGRKKSCNIFLESTLLSKIHCTIFYNSIENCWEIKDGFEKHSSTNGTWLWINSKYEITEDKTFVKIANNIIRISVIT